MRNESFSKPTMVPMILVPSFRRISSARTAAATIVNNRSANEGNALPRMVSSMAKAGMNGQDLGGGEVSGVSRTAGDLMLEV